LKQLLVVVFWFFVRTFTEKHPNTMDSCGVYHHEVGICRLWVKAMVTVGVAKLDLQAYSVQVRFLEVFAIPPL
jgi:hypothetical protein